MNKFGKLVFAGIAATSLGVATSASATAATTAGHHVVASTSAAVPLSAEIQAQLKGTPAAVQQWVEGLAAQGQHVLGLASAPYTWKTATKSNATIRPDDYPVGCGLYVVISQADSTHIQSNNLTSCLTTASYIEMESGLAYLASGNSNWDEVAHDDDDIDDSLNLSMDYDYDCAGTGKRTYQTPTEGEVEIDGATGTAAAYDEATYTCS
jgi:hypothetical protein